METMQNLSLDRFTALLADKVSVPGGGGAAALCGALAASLCSMAAVFTLGKKKFAEVEPQMAAAAEECGSIRRELLELIDRDAAAFEPLSRAYAIPKEDPDRPRVLEEATKAALAAPMDMLRTCARAVPLMELTAEKGTKMLISDAGCAAVLCRAAMECAYMNVLVNTRTLSDRLFALSLENEAAALLHECTRRCDAAADTVTKYLKG